MKYTIVFSPTGGTSKVVHALINQSDERWKELDLTDPQLALREVSFAKEDYCIIAVPSYGGRIPDVVRTRLSHVQGQGCRVILVTSYGNRAYEDTLLELQELIISCGFEPIGAIAAIAQHSIMPQFGKGRPNQQDVLELQGFMKEIIAQATKRGNLSLPGNYPYRTYKGVPIKPKATSACTSCGVCANNCPVAAISKQQPNVTDKARCISCMRCVTICPQHARKVNSLFLFAASQSMKKSCATPKENECFLLGETR